MAIFSLAWRIIFIWLRWMDQLDSQKDVCLVFGDYSMACTDTLVSLCLCERINHSSSCVGNSYTKDIKKENKTSKSVNLFLNSDSLSSSHYRVLSQNGWPIFAYTEGYSRSLFQANLGI